MRAVFHTWKNTCASERPWVLQQCVFLPGATKGSLKMRSYQITWEFGQPCIPKQSISIRHSLLMQTTLSLHIVLIKPTDMFLPLEKDSLKRKFRICPKYFSRSEKGWMVYLLLVLQDFTLEQNIFFYSLTFLVRYFLS